MAPLAHLRYPCARFVVNLSFPALPSDSYLCPEAYYGRAQAQAITEVNVERMPRDICKQLAKLRSKSCGPSTPGKRDAVGSPGGVAVGDGDDGDRDDTVVPPGYLLVEYYGSHDFGWVKADSILPFAAAGATPVHGRGRVGGGKEGLRLAAATECWRLRETFAFLPAAARARVIEALAADRCGCDYRRGCGCGGCGISPGPHPRRPTVPRGPCRHMLNSPLSSRCIPPFPRPLDLRGVSPQVCDHRQVPRVAEPARSKKEGRSCWQHPIAG